MALESKGFWLEITLTVNGTGFLFREIWNYLFLFETLVYNPEKEDGTVHRCGGNCSAHVYPVCPCSAFPGYNDNGEGCNCWQWRVILSLGNHSFQSRVNLIDYALIVDTDFDNEEQANILFVPKKEDAFILKGCLFYKGSSQASQEKGIQSLHSQDALIHKRNWRVASFTDLFMSQGH